MKKIFSLIFTALLASTLYAGPITPEKALQVAQKVFESAPATKAASGDLKIVWDGSFSSLQRDADAAFYVVARDGGGFVIVSGYDNVKPILGLSFENNFSKDNMPDNVRAWMEMLKRHARSGAAQTEEVREQWAAYTATGTKATPVTTGLTNEFTSSRTNMWNQTNPGNYYCPQIPGEQYSSVSGCVAVATAEVMAWFGTQNISSASGTVPSYTIEKNSYTVPAHDLGTVYDWANLHTLASSNASDFYYQINGFKWTLDDTSFYNKLYGGQEANVGTTLTTLGYNVAQLIYDIGTLVQASYSYSGTGAFTFNVVKKVAPAFGYNNSALAIDKDRYTNGQWLQIMKDEITKHPVIYDGTASSTGGGHAYVADGYATYNGDLLIHFNMGWGGSNNGYYTLDIQEDYDKSHTAILDFYPNPSASTPIPLLGYSKSGGLQYKSGYNTGTLNFAIMAFYNKGATDFNGVAYMRQVNAAGNFVKTQAFTSTFNLPAFYGSTHSVYAFNSVNFTFNNPSLGDRVVIYSKVDGSSTYVPFHGEPGIANFLELPAFPAAAIKTQSSYAVGDYIVFELTNHSYSYSDATWYVTDPDGVKTSYPGDTYRVQLKKAGEYKIEASIPDQETVVTFITVH